MDFGKLLRKELEQLKKEFDSIGEVMEPFNFEDYTTIEEHKKVQTARLKRLKKEKGIDD